MRIKSLIATIISLLILLNNSEIFAQDWVGMMSDPKVNFYDVQKSFNDFWQGKEVQRSKGYKQFKRWEKQYLNF